MNPNLTVSYLALRATRQSLDQQATRGWQATQAAQLTAGHGSAGGPALSHWLVVRAARSPWLVMAARRIVLAAGAGRVLEAAG